MRLRFPVYGISLIAARLRIPFPLYALPARHNCSDLSDHTDCNTSFRRVHLEPSICSRIEKLGEYIQLCSAINISSLLLLIFLTATASFGQVSDFPNGGPPAKRDDVAIAVIRQALKSMGGQAALSSIKDTKAEADCTRVSSKKTDSHHVRWINAGDSFRIDGGSGDTRGAVSGAHGRLIVLNGKTVPLDERGARAMKQIHLPSLLLATALANNSFQMESLDTEDLIGQRVAHVRITDIKASAQSFEPVSEDWYFSVSTGLPIKLMYSVQGLNSLRRFANTTIEYRNFITEPSSGLIVPSSFRRSFEGGPSTTCVLSSLSVNNNPDATTFMIKSGGAK